MPHFQVTILKHGRQENLTITAADSRGAQQQVEKDGHTVVDVFELEAIAASATTGAPSHLKPDRTLAYLAFGVGLLLCMFGFTLLYITTNKGRPNVGFAMPMMSFGIVLMGASTRWMFRN